ncbi:MAG TPA: DUF3011 domain-containing protein, partial [Xanthomonadales bacterium]|nr:DUF3011 domain-containing protein [Xanthomonadales bacterium]
MRIAHLLPVLFVLAAAHVDAQPRQSTLARIVCSGQEQGYQFCEVETRYGVRLTRQISRARCIQGSSWGYDRRGIWVDRGCAAEFEVGDPGYGGEPEAAGYPVRPGETVGVPGDLFTCESRDGRRRYCRADLRGLQPTVVRNISREPCVLGQNWNYDAGGVWVDFGCRAEFRVIAPPTPIENQAGVGHASTSDVVRCESRDFRRTVCETGRNRGVELTRQVSKARCVEGDTWGWDRRGVWVDGGCGGEF